MTSATADEIKVHEMEVSGAKSDAVHVEVEKAQAELAAVDAHAATVSAELQAEEAHVAELEADAEEARRRGNTAAAAELQVKASEARKTLVRHRAESLRDLAEARRSAEAHVTSATADEIKANEADSLFRQGATSALKDDTQKRSNAFHEVTNLHAQNDESELLYKEYGVDIASLSPDKKSLFIEKERELNEAQSLLASAEDDLRFERTALDEEAIEVATLEHEAEAARLRGDVTRARNMMKIAEEAKATLAQHRAECEEEMVNAYREAEARLEAASVEMIKVREEIVRSARAVPESKHYREVVALEKDAERTRTRGSSVVASQVAQHAAEARSRITSTPSKDDEPFISSRGGLGRAAKMLDASSQGPSSSVMLGKHKGFVIDPQTFSKIPATFTLSADSISDATSLRVKATSVGLDLVLPIDGKLTSASQCGSRMAVSTSLAIELESNDAAEALSSSIVSRGVSVVALKQDRPYASVAEKAHLFARLVQRTEMHLEAWLNAMVAPSAEDPGREREAIRIIEESKQRVLESAASLGLDTADILRDAEDRDSGDVRSLVLRYEMMRPSVERVDVGVGPTREEKLEEEAARRIQDTWRLGRAVRRNAQPGLSLTMEVIAELLRAFPRGEGESAWPEGLLESVQNLGQDPASLATLQLLRTLHAHVKKLSQHTIDMKRQYTSDLTLQRMHGERTANRQTFLAREMERLSVASEMDAIKAELREERMKRAEAEARVEALRDSLNMMISS